MSVSTLVIMSRLNSGDVRPFGETDELELEFFLKVVTDWSAMFMNELNLSAVTEAVLIELRHRGYANHTVSFYRRIVQAQKAYERLSGLIHSTKNKDDDTEPTS